MRKLIYKLLKPYIDKRENEQKKRKRELIERLFSRVNNGRGL